VKLWVEEGKADVYGRLTIVTKNEYKVQKTGEMKPLDMLSNYLLNF
jgi:hypothetical protein